MLTGKFLWKSWSLQSNFCHRNMSQNIKSDRIYAICCGDKIMLQRQRFSQKFSTTHEEIFRLDVSLQHVAATSRLTCIYTRSHLLPWRVTATCCLVCSDLNSLIIKPWEMLTSKSWCKGSHLSCHSIQVQICLQGFQVNFKDGISRFKGTEKTTIASCLLDH